MLRGQADTTRVQGAVKTKLRAADTTRAAGKTTAKTSSSALASEPRDTSDHADNRGDEYNQGTYDSDPRYENGDQGMERDDSENKREYDGQTGQSEEGGSGQE